MQAEATSVGWHALSQINRSVSPDQKIPFIFSCFLTSKSVELDLRELWISELTWTTC